MPEQIAVTLAAGVVQLLQLDSGSRLPDGRHGWRYSYDAGPVDVEYTRGGRSVRVTGDAAALREMRGHARAAEYYCGAAWYPRAARAAMRALDGVLAGYDRAQTREG